MSGLVRTGARQGFDTVELDSPANRNALSLGLMDDLLDAVRRSAAGPGRGLVLGHTGPAFCSGVDLNERRRLGPEDGSHSTRLAILLRELWEYPKPLVATVDGSTRGGGLGVLACADLVLAGERSTFAFSETRVGVAPALVMAVTLPRVAVRSVVPRLLDGGVLGAADAAEAGLVTQVVREHDPSPLDDVLADLLRGAPGAQAVVKQLVRRWSAPDVERRIHEATAMSAELFAGAEAREGMAAFGERRPPAWTVPGEVAS